MHGHADNGRQAAGAVATRPSPWAARRIQAALLASQWRLLVVLLLFVPVPAAQGNDPRCARIDQRQGYGPFDYRKGRGKLQENLYLVESAHLRPDHQRGALEGDTGRPPSVWVNLDYTLRAFPNHPHALYLLGVFEHIVARDKPEDAKALQRLSHYAPVSCYFERAIRFAPDDPNVYNALGRLQVLRGERDEAVTSFQRVVELAPESAEAHYNLGLARYAAGQYPEAAASARQAYARGYDRPELKNRLATKGYWK